MAEPAIAADQLFYRYGERVAVDQISFSVEAGEVIGFLGPNGAGKSTTVKLLTGQLRPLGGRALLLGQDITQHTKALQAQIGICFEITNLYEPMAAADNLKLFARLFGVREFDPEALLERVGLGGKGKLKVETFSKGMRQRLMVARALVNKPRILFLDEPTAGLDPVSAEAIRQIILEEQARGVTVFLTTHDMVEADKLSNRVAFINNGRIVALDTPYALKQQYGRRALKVETVGPDGRLHTHEVPLDAPETAAQLSRAMAHGPIATVHSEEATLEDIFIQITGRGLVA